MPEKEDREFTAEQQKFLIEEFREIQHKIEDSYRKHEEMMGKIKDSLDDVQKSLARIEGRINTLLMHLPKLGKGEDTNLWVMLVQILQAFVLIYTIFKWSSKQ